MEKFKHSKISEHLVRIECPGNVYAFLVSGNERALLIDTGFGAGSLKEYISGLTSLTYDVVLTHGHLDHAGGAGEFENVYVSSKDLPLLAFHTDVDIRWDAVRGSLGLISETNSKGAEDGHCIKAGSGIQDRIEDTKACMIAQKPVNEYLDLSDEQEFALGGVTVKMLPLNGHTPGCMCALVKEDRVVLLGDACNSLGFMQIDGALPLTEYLKELKNFKRYDNLYDEVIYSHPHNFGGKVIVDETILLCEEIIGGKRAGLPFGATAEWGQALIAKEKDERDRPTDGTVANFIYREKYI